MFRLDQTLKKGKKETKKMALLG